MEGTGLAAESEKRQANVLLHVTGPESVRVYNGFTWDDPTHRMQPGKVLDKFRTYCTPWTNVTFERHKFVTRLQKDSELFECFYAELCSLANLNC